MIPTKTPKLTKHILLLPLLALAAGCKPEISISHSPAIAKSNEPVTFTATVLSDGPADVEILVNARLVHTCEDVPTNGTCEFVGGPYPERESLTVSYSVRATNDDGTKSRGYYHFGITDEDYNYLPSGVRRYYVPARYVGDPDEKTDLLFHRAADYHDPGNGGFERFVLDATDKIFDVLGRQVIIREPYNLDQLNFWIYLKTAQNANDCGIVHADTDVDMPWREDDAVLHKADFGDCTAGGRTHFSAEGWNTQAFLHESGHAIFDLSDEYDGPTRYRESANETNIFSSQARCQAEQTAKGRDPDTCRKFTNRQGGWWGTHPAGVNYVMVRGQLGDPWSPESEEHMLWFFE